MQNSLAIFSSFGTYGHSHGVSSDLPRWFHSDWAVLQDMLKMFRKTDRRAPSYT